MQTFGVLLLEKENKFQSLLVPDITKYKEWNVNQMIQWISSLNDGKFNKYCDNLRNAFVSDGIENGEIMVQLTRHDLRNNPFNVTSFTDRKELELHFLKC